jgi:hypothetical protein
MKQRWMRIVWPLPLRAAVLELVAFAFVAPQGLRWLHGRLDVSWQAAYAAALFLFWAVTAASRTLRTMLFISPFEVNRSPTPSCERPDTCKVQSKLPYPPLHSHSRKETRHEHF